jgi:hypothetical protein
MVFYREPFRSGQTQDGVATSWGDCCFTSNEATYEFITEAENVILPCSGHLSYELTVARTRSVQASTAHPASRVSKKEEHVSGVLKSGGYTKSIRTGERYSGRSLGSCLALHSLSLVAPFQALDHTTSINALQSD